VFKCVCLHKPLTRPFVMLLLELVVSCRRAGRLQPRCDISLILLSLGGGLARKGLSGCVLPITAVGYDIVEGNISTCSCIYPSILVSLGPGMMYILLKVLLLQLELNGCVISLAESDWTLRPPLMNMGC
jgi:hypothetical protein